MENQLGQKMPSTATSNGSASPKEISRPHRCAFGGAPLPCAMGAPWEEILPVLRSRGIVPTASVRDELLHMLCFHTPKKSVSILDY